MYSGPARRLRLELRVRPAQTHNAPDQTRQIARLRQQQPRHQRQQRQQQRLPAQAQSIGCAKVLAFKHQLGLRMVIAANEFRFEPRNGILFTGLLRQNCRVAKHVTSKLAEPWHL